MLSGVILSSQCELTSVVSFDEEKKKFERTSIAHYMM
jgi:hypothetical protein